MIEFVNFIGTYIVIGILTCYLYSIDPFLKESISTKNGDYDGLFVCMFFWFITFPVWVIWKFLK